MGPMNAARAFVEDLAARGELDRTARLGVQLYGSLALTGKGHCTDRAILLGLEGQRPDSIDAAAMEPALERIRTTGRLRLGGTHEIEFDEPLDLLFHRDQLLPLHPNGMRFTALAVSGEVLHRDEYYSTGGGFTVRAAEFGHAREDGGRVATPHPSRLRGTCCRPPATTGSSFTSSCSRTSARTGATSRPGTRCSASGR